jgi:hypothetical protein
MIRPCNLSPSPKHTCNFHFEPFAPLVGINLPFKGWHIINVLVKNPIHLIQTHVLKVDFTKIGILPSFHENWILTTKIKFLLSNFFIY